MISNLPSNGGHGKGGSRKYSLMLSKAFEGLYGNRCMTPLCLYEFYEIVVFGSKIIQQTTEKVNMIQENMNALQLS